MNILQSVCIAQLVQVSIVGLVAWLLADTLFRRRPRLQSAVWSVVLLKCLVPPLMPSLVWPDALSGPATWSVHENSDFEPRHSDASFVTTVKMDAAAGGEAISPRRIPPATAYKRISLADVSIVIWMTGVSLILVLITIRVRRIRYQLRRRWPRSVGQLESAFAQVQDRFRSRNLRSPKVRLIITRGRFGPASMQPIDPLIAIPGKLAERLTSPQLESVLAHEMMHVRRGDLWLGCLQTIAVGLYWFHPLVWIASRRLSIAVEQCCDEDSLRLLQCDPVDYRHGLLATVLWKNSVPALPVASAIRPAQLTRYRMEALMKIDPTRPVASWKSRLLWLLMVVLVLPGASSSVSAPPTTLQPTNPVTTDKSQTEANAAPNDTEPEAFAEGMSRLVRVYRVQDLVKDVNFVDESPIKKEIGNSSIAVFDPLMRELMEEVAPESWESAGGPGTMAPYPQNHSLVVSTTRAVHDAIVEFLEKKRANRNRVTAPAVTSIHDPSSDVQIEMRSVFLMGRSDDLEKASDAWRLSDDHANAGARLKENAELPKTIESESFRWAIVAPESVESFVNSLEDGNRVLICSRPTLKLSPLTKGAIEVVKLREAPVSPQDMDLINQPSRIGMKLELTAATSRSADGDPSTFIALSFSSQQIVSIELESDSGSGGTGDSFFTPRKLQFKVDLPHGKTLLVLQSHGGDDSQSNLLAVHRAQ